MPHLTANAGMVLIPPVLNPQTSGVLIPGDLVLFPSCTECHFPESMSQWFIKSLSHLKTHVQIHRGKSLMVVSNVKRVSIRLVIWRHKPRYIVVVSNVRRVSFNLVVWRNMPGYTGGRSQLLVSNVKRVSLNLVAWRHMPRYIVGRSLFLVSNV